MHRYCQAFRFLFFSMPTSFMSMLSSELPIRTAPTVQKKNSSILVDWLSTLLLTSASLFSMVAWLFFWVFSMPLSLFSMLAWLFLTSDFSSRATAVVQAQNGINLRLCQARLEQSLPLVQHAPCDWPSCTHGSPHKAAGHCQGHCSCNQRITLFTLQQLTGLPSDAEGVHGPKHNSNWNNPPNRLTHLTLN